ncbi:MAG: hypothetical protein LBR35_00385 [Rickettsiales bacterium]|nr:hypothetical protein [Rickettsiales bacterium]
MNDKNAEMKIHLKNDLKSLKKKFEDFDIYPKEVKQVLLDMEYNMGGNFHGKKGGWPRFFEAIKNQEWSIAANEVLSKDIGKERNEWRRNMLNSISDIAIEQRKKDHIIRIMRR